MGKKRKTATIGAAVVVLKGATLSSAFVILPSHPSHYSASECAAGFSIATRSIGTCSRFPPLVSTPCVGHPIGGECGCNQNFIHRRSLIHTASGRTYKSGLSPNEEEDDAHPLSAGGPLTLDEMSSKLLSYASSIRRGRSEFKKSRGRVSGAAARSLIHRLSTESNAMRQVQIGDDINRLLLVDSPLRSPDDITELRQALSKASVSAIRSAADGGDYALILGIVDAVVEYGTALFDSTGVAILPGRIFGEAIAGLSRSSASQSKLKRIWSVFVGLAHDPDRTILASPPSSYELNAILAGLSARKRVRSALDLYRTSGVGGDSFTASILFEMLAGSIPDRRGTINTVRGAATAASTGSFCDSIDEQQGVEGLASSVCWQWNEALLILSDLGRSGSLNNFAFTSALKVNKQAGRLFGGQGRKKYLHDGGASALFLLNQMKACEVSPDGITCTSVLQALEEAGYWKEAVELLEAMEAESLFLAADTAAEREICCYPPPNIYSYASAVSVCFRCGMVDEGTTILDRLSTSTSRKVIPETWVYNRALQALMNTQQTLHRKQMIDNNDRFEVAARLLSMMKEGVRSRDMDTSPDTITYNTILSGTVLRSSSDARIIFRILNEMANDGVERSFVTYRSAIQACRAYPEIAIKVLDANDEERSDLSSFSQTEKEDILNFILDICADERSIMSISCAFHRIVEQEGVEPDLFSFAHITRALASANDESGLVLLFNALKSIDGTDSAKDIFLQRYDIDVAVADYGSAFEVANLCSVAMASLLEKDNLTGAMVLLSTMEKCGLEATESSLQSIVLEHCRLAMANASEEFKMARRESMQGASGTRSHLLRPVQHISSSHAQVALEITRKMGAPQASLYCAVTKACYSSGRSSDGYAILNKLHNAALSDVRSNVTVGDSLTVFELPRLHYQLFKLFARSGNVTCALGIADAVAMLSRQVSGLLEKDFDDALEVDPKQITIRAKDKDPLDFSMCGEDWKLLMIAASKSGHWKVCVSTLDLLQPYVKSTNIGKHLKLSDTHIRRLNRDYSCLSRAITAAILCFETRSQYAWAVRSIEDWIEWSRRGPPPEAVSSACRILAKRGKGQQVISLMTRILQVPQPMFDKENNDLTYDRIVYNEAIMALYNHGLYDRADELYVSAVSRDVLPWMVSGFDENDSQLLTLDLHGMTRASAHSAVRIALQREIQSQSWNATTGPRDFIIITGRGKGSLQRYRPVVRPEVQRMLCEEFYPPLSTSSVPGNMGALQVSSGDIQAWLEHQNEQKDLRMLAIADLLKDLSSSRRITSAITKGQTNNKEE